MNEPPAAVRDYIDRIVAEAPPLTPSQRERITELLRPARTVPGGGAGAA